MEHTNGDDEKAQLFAEASGIIRSVKLASVIWPSARYRKQLPDRYKQFMYFALTRFNTSPSGRITTRHHQARSARRLPGRHEKVSVIGGEYIDSTPV